MMDETPPSMTEATDPRPAGSLLGWLAAGVVATTALSLAAAHAPPRIRLIGLFSIVFGLVVGWVLAVLANKLDVKLSRITIGIVAAILTLGGLIGSTWETFRIEQARLAKTPKDGVALRLMEQMKMHPETTEMKQMDTSALAEFRRHLSRRLRQLGDWSSPWPETFWMAELIVGTAAGVWMSCRCLTGVSPTTADHVGVSS